MEISKPDRQKIKDAFVDGLTRDELALIFGVHPNTITNVLGDKHTDTLDERADMMEAMLGGATRDDGCHDASVPENTLVPEALIDNNDPLSVLLATEEILNRTSGSDAEGGQ